MNFLVVFLGGGVGALARYILTLLMPKMTYFPENTLLANFLGCFLATVIFVYFVSKCETESVYKIFFITGFCGGLSTLSALSIELLQFIHAGEYIRAISYSIITVIICTLSVVLGLLLTKYCLNIKL